MADREPVRISSEALFRYRVAGAVEALVAMGRSLADAVHAFAGDVHTDIDGRLRRISTRTLYRWVAAYRRAGIAGIEPAGRQHIDSSIALDEQLVRFMQAERELDRDASVPEIVRRARELGIVRRDEKVSRCTAWRTLRRLGLPTTKRKVRKRDSRRFQYAERMQMLITDFVHFSAGARRRRRVACYVLDDSTRFGLDVLVHGGKGERPETFLLLLFRVLALFGFMDALYSDGGDAYIAGDTARVMANLRVRHVIGEPHYPEGRGKIEVFNRSARARVLRGFDGNPTVDPDPGSLTLRLRHDLQEIYNNTPHEGIDLDTPRARWERSRRDLRPVPDHGWLAGQFFVTQTRRVSNDHVIKHGGRKYEVPRGLAGERINVERNVLDSSIHVMHEGRLVELHPVDLEANATSPRAKPADQTDTVCVRTTASAISFERSFGSVLDQDGGCKE
ncbi:MAG: Transposase [Actinomycetota bacterium]|nr:Transposase [Actinomycetota bacterium]